MDGWPPIKVKRFARERTEAYEWRAARIREIVEGFRTGRYLGEVGEEMERTLEALRTSGARSYEVEYNKAA